MYLYFHLIVYVCAKLQILIHVDKKDHWKFQALGFNTF